MRKFVGSNIISQFHHRLCNNNDYSNLFTKSLFQFLPRFLNTNARDSSPFQEASGLDVYDQFVNTKTDSWYSERNIISDSPNVCSIWPSRVDETADSLSLNIDMPGVVEEDVKVSVQHTTLVIEGQGDEKFLVDRHPFEKYISWVDLEYGIYNFSGIKAEMKKNQGVLKLIIPKMKQEEVRAYFNIKVNFVDKLD